MKILFVIYFAGIGGAERYLLDLIPALQKAGVDCEQLNIYPNAKEKEANAYGKDLSGLGIRFHNLGIASALSIKPLSAINKIYKTGKFDAVHTHMIHADLWCTLVKRFLNRKMVIFSTKHGYKETVYLNHVLTPQDVPRNLFYRAFKLAESGIDRSFSCSFGLRNFYEKAGLVKKGQIDVIEHGFDYPPPPEQEDPTFRLGTPQLVIVGRLSEIKGHTYAFQALPHLKKKYPNIKLVLAGIGAFEENLREEVKALGIEDQVEFLGYQTEVLAWSNNSDIVLVPSFGEGLPLVVLEGFNSMKPVVAFDTIGCQDVIENGKDGILVPPYEVDTYRDKILYLLENPEERDRLAGNAFSKLKNHYSLNRMAQDTLDFYKKYLP